MTKHITPIETLDPAEIALLLHAGKLLLIDVREPEEYAAEGISGALLYPLSTFDAAKLRAMARGGLCFTVGAVSARSPRRSGVSPVSLMPLTWAAALQPGRPRAYR